MADVSLGVGVLLAQPIGNRRSSRRLRNLGMSQSSSIARKSPRTCCRRRNGSRHAGAGEVAAADEEPAVAGVLEVGERAGLEGLGRHEADIVTGVGCEPGSGVRLRVGKVDEGGQS